MRSVDWKSVLRHHAVFRDLSDKETDALLHEGVSAEKEFQPGEVILREGESGDAVYLIGSGAVEVSIRGEEGEKLRLATLRSGELIGEMSTIDNRPRAATVDAVERCTLLEIRGPEFLDLSHRHPGIEFKLLHKMSERLRTVNEEVLAVRFKHVDDKLRFYNTKLDAQLKVFDASLKASQAVFDQTNSRASEAIQSVEKTRARWNVTASAVFAAASALAGLLGWFGINQFTDIRDNLESQSQSELEKVRRIGDEAKEIGQRASNETQNIVKMRKELIEDLERIEGRLAGVETAQLQIAKINEEYEIFRAERGIFYKQILIPRFRDLALEDSDRAVKAFKVILNAQNPEITNHVFTIINREIVGNKVTRDAHRKVLRIATEKEDLDARAKGMSYYFLLWSYVLDESIDEYEEVLDEFRNFTKFDEHYDPTQFKKDLKDFTLSKIMFVIDATAKNKIKKSLMQNQINNIWVQSRKAATGSD